MNRTVADGAQKHAGEAAETAGADDKKFRASGGIQERVSGLIVDELSLVTSTSGKSRRAVAIDWDSVVAACDWRKLTVHSTWRLEGWQGGMRRRGPRVRR